MSKLTWTVLLIASMAGIAAFYPIVKTLDGAINPYLLAFFRFFIASLALLPIMTFRRSLRLPSVNQWPLFLFIAVCAVVPTVLIVMGIAKTNSIVSAILMNTNPLLVALLAPFLISEQMTGAKAAALAIGFLGVVLVIFNGQDPSILFNSAYFWGSLILLAAAFFSGLNKIYSKGLVRSYDGLYVTFFAVMLGSVMLALLVTLTNGFASVLQFTAREIVFVVLIGVICTAIPWVIWASSLKHLDVHVAASYGLLIPVFAALYSFVLFTENFTLWMLLGLVLTSIGIYTVQREEKVAPSV